MLWKEFIKTRKDPQFVLSHSLPCHNHLLSHFTTLLHNDSTKQYQLYIKKDIEISNGSPKKSQTIIHKQDIESSRSIECAHRVITSDNIQIGISENYYYLCLKNHKDLFNHSLRLQLLLRKLSQQAAVSLLACDSLSRKLVIRRETS